MSKFFKYFFHTFIVPAFIYWLEPSLDQIFQHLGIDRERWPAQIIADFESLTSSPVFFNCALVGAGMYVGVWMHIGIASFERRKSEKFKSLSPEISRLKGEIWEHAEQPDGSHKFAAPDRQLRDKLLALFAELKRVGVKTPDIDRYQGATFSLYSEHFLAAIEPYSKFGQRRQASVAGDKKAKETEKAFQMMADTQSKGH